MSRLLNASVFDRLEQIANEVGGVGQRDFFDDGVPCCIHGMALRADDHDDQAMSMGVHELALHQSAINSSSNDKVVRQWLLNHPEITTGRMPWDEYVKAMDIERGA